jgi:hypothetical protein
MANFNEQTKEAIERCAEYLVEHKDALADQICAMPSKEWSIEFRMGDDGISPWLEIRSRSNAASVTIGYLVDNCE